MNKDQIASLVRTGLKTGAGFLIAQGNIKSDTGEMLIAVAMLLFGWLWSHYVHDDNEGGGTPLNTPKAAAILVFAGLLATSGCSTAYQSNKITAIKERGFGIVLAQAPANQTPELKLGFFSSVIQLIPTAENGTVGVPRYMDTLDIGSGLNPFGTDIRENTGTGDVMVGSGTNDTSKAIIPGAYIPPQPKAPDVGRLGPVKIGTNGVSQLSN